MKDLLKEAIADAKAVRETALANAKIALEEAFTPRLQSMLSAKLSEEEDMEMSEEEEMEMDVAAEEPAPAPEPEVEEPVAEGDYADDEMSEEEDMEMSETDDIEMEEGEDVDMELEAILRELEEEPVEEGHGEGHEEEPVAEGEDKEEMTEEEDADVSIEEVIKALREEEDGEMKEEEEKMEEGEDKELEEADEKDLEEAYKVIKFLRSKINEVNLLNAKLLFSNKLFRNYPLSESQKMKVIENFDRAQSLREVKLVFGTLAESFTATKTKRKVVKESYASKASRSTAPKKEILSEGNQLAARWKKLANLK
jgi:hypothetical protein